jgi:ACS family hexuronate transporter-like MFS transporter
MLMPLSLIIPFMHSTEPVLYLAMVIALCHAAWLTNITAYIVDLVPSPVLGTAFGFIAAGSALGGIFMNEAVGWAITHYSYTPCFYIMAILHPVAFMVIWLFGTQWKISAKDVPNAVAIAK